MMRCTKCSRWILSGRAVAVCRLCEELLDRPVPFPPMPRRHSVVARQFWELYGMTPAEAAGDPCPERASDGYCHCKHTTHKQTQPTP